MSYKSGKKTRLAIVNASKCKPKKCNLECKKSCPRVRIGTECVVVDKISKCASISEELCIGCGICVNACPFDAIKIINLPNELSAPVTFRYGRNSFQLHRLPQLRPNQVMGVVGVNGIGKSTIIKILAGKVLPNFGIMEQHLGLSKQDNVEEIIKTYRGSDLQNYFSNLYTDQLKPTVKPQMVEYLSRAPGTKHKLVRDVLPSESVRQKYSLNHLSDRKLEVLSGGELQRMSIAKICSGSSLESPHGHVYFFDEPSNYLDIKQRLMIGREIRNLKERPGTYVMVVDHDIALLDFISDYVSCLYGKAGAYGVVSLPSTVREGLNSYLRGYLPAENMRIRPDYIKFVRSEVEEEEKLVSYGNTPYDYSYPSFQIKKGTFQLDVEKGGWYNSEVILLVGQNGTGKTTLVRKLAGLERGESFSNNTSTHLQIPEMNVSLKPQHIIPHFQGTVRQLLATKIPKTLYHPLFKSDVLDPLQIAELFDNEVQHLSGGELQRVSITLALGKPADVYLLDEPFSFLDIEMRLAAATAIRRYVKHSGKSALVVEHDILMGLYLADRVIVYSGDPGVKCIAHTPCDKESGMNCFLRDLDVTIRQDPDTHRPRINKAGSSADQEQKSLGIYYKTLASRTK